MNEWMTQPKMQYSRQKVDQRAGQRTQGAARDAVTKIRKI